MKKIGDIISWEFENKTYTEKIIGVSKDKKYYYVYVKYPMFESFSVDKIKIK